MESRFFRHQPPESSEVSASEAETDLVLPSEIAVKEPFAFQTSFTGTMEMYSDAATVAEYLGDHQGWFCRCAQPMKVEPFSDNGYILVIGRFGSFGYEVEPKIAVVLLPPEGVVYKMHSVALPETNCPGYEVDYQASLQLSEIPESEGTSQIITNVEWQLNLSVKIEFPSFIYKLPHSVIKTTGERVLSQILRQVSRRLTSKVQADFHSRYNLPVPKKKRM